MEYLVIMKPHVPYGTPEQEVNAGESTDRGGLRAQARVAGAAGGRCGRQPVSGCLGDCPLPGSLRGDDEDAAGPGAAWPGLGRVGYAEGPSEAAEQRAR